MRNIEMPLEALLIRSFYVPYIIYSKDPCANWTHGIVNSHLTIDFWWFRWTNCSNYSCIVSWFDCNRVKHCAISIKFLLFAWTWRAHLYGKVAHEHDLERAHSWSKITRHSFLFTLTIVLLVFAIDLDVGLILVRVRVYWRHVWK